jgi:putative oxidoreductase
MSTTATTLPTKRLDIALTILRVVVGLVFLAHGGQKLFVYGFAGVSAGFAQMGIPMAAVMGPFIALLEFFGGAAILFGLLTRLAGLGLALNMLGAIAMVHGKNGFFMPTGIEYALTLLGASATLALTGAGRFSLDALIAGRTRRAATATAASPVRRVA